MWMGSAIGKVDERLKLFTGQLQTECGILERLVYKHKNQHRRCSYFQYVLKVRRDLKLMKLANMEEIVEASFLVINGNRPKQKVQLLESLKRRKCSSGKYNFLERLLGVTRLLSQMVEPLLKAAMEISTLLARSFFMKFSLTVLAALARIRVLIQQMLLDAVFLFNTVSSISQKEHTVKLNQEGFEVFREYYLQKEEATIRLECIWQMDKYVLAERQIKMRPLVKRWKIKEIAYQMHQKYYMRTLMFFSEVVDESGLEASEHPSTDSINVVGTRSDIGVTKTKRVFKTPLDTAGTSIDINSSGLVFSNPSKTNIKESVEDDSGNARNPTYSKGISPEPGLPTSSTTPAHLYSVKKETKKRVAFIAIKPPALTTKESSSHLKGTEKIGEDKGDPLFNLLNGVKKNSLL